MDSDMSYQIVARQFLAKVTKFGSVCSKIKKVIRVQSRRGRNSPPPPPVYKGLTIVNNSATGQLPLKSPGKHITVGLPLQP